MLGTGLLFASLRVTVIVEVATLSATTGPDPVTLEFAATAGPAVKTTVPSAFETGVTIERVFVSDFVDLIVHVDTPEEFVAEQAWYVFPVPVSVAENVGVIPITGLFDPSLKVMVTVEVATPLAITGPVPVMFEFAATAVPAVKTTVPPVFETGAVIESVFVSAVSELKVQVESPDAFVAEQEPCTFVVPVFVAENVGVSPETGLLFTSLRLIVTVEVAEPLAITGPVPVIVEFAATGVPAVKMTVPSAFTTGVAIESVFVSALRDVIVHVDTPDAFVTEHDP